MLPGHNHLIMEPQDWEEVESVFWLFYFPTGSSPEQRQLSDS